MSKRAWHNCHWFDLRVHWPGSASARIGILLRDDEGGKLHLKIQPNWWKSKADPIEELILSGLHDGLIEIANDIGAEGLFDWLENNASHLLRVGPQSEIQTDDVEATLQSLFQEHCSQPSWFEITKRSLGRLRSSSSVFRRAQWLQPLAITAAFAFVVPEVATHLVYQRSEISSQTAPRRSVQTKRSGLSGARFTYVDEAGDSSTMSLEPDRNPSSRRDLLTQESSTSKNRQSFAELYSVAANHPLMSIDKFDDLKPDDSLNLNLPSIWSEIYRTGVKSTGVESSPAKASDSVPKTSEENRSRPNIADESKRELAASILNDTNSPSLVSPITGGTGPNISFPGGAPIPPPSEESVLSPPSEESTVPPPGDLVLPPSANTPDPLEPGLISNSPEPTTTIEFVVGLMVLASTIWRQKLRTRSPLKKEVIRRI